MRVLTKFADAVRNGAARVSRKRPVHVDAIERRRPGIRDASALAELRHQNDPAGHLLGIQVAAQPLDSDLPLVFVPVRSAEAQDAVRVGAAPAR